MQRRRTEEENVLEICLTCFYLNLGQELGLANKKSLISGTILSNKSKVSLITEYSCGALTFSALASVVYKD